MANFSFRDTINGSRASATAIINGKVEQLFMIKSLEATISKNKEEGRVLGGRMTQHKANGESGTGSMTIFYVSPIFRRMMLEYHRTGKDVYFTITITLEDEASSVGKQTTALYYCNIDEINIAKIDLESTALEEDIPFTFEDWDLTNEFNRI